MRGVELQALLIDLNDPLRHPWVQSEKNPGIRSRVRYKNWADGALRPYCAVGITDHIVEKDTEFKSSDLPDVHGALGEYFSVTGGALAMYLRYPSGEKEPQVLFTDMDLFVPHGVEHWFKALTEVRLTTITSSHRDYDGDEPWSPTAQIEV